MSTSNQQTLTDSGANDRPPMLEKGPYDRPLINDPDDDKEKILEPLSKMTESNKKQYIADVKVMNYLLQAILNDIYNSVDACKMLRKCRNGLKVVDYEEDYQGKLQGDSQEDKRTTDGRVDIQTKNAGYGGNNNRVAERQNRNQAFNAGTGNDESNQIVQ
ncbi:hypothetical protein Tco_1451080 [Tanacetum coccineum]